MTLLPTFRALGGRPWLRRCLALSALLLSVCLVFGDPARGGEGPAVVPDAGASVLRVFGALIFVLALFFGGIWLVRNWRRTTVPRGRAPKLNILEMRSLGHRHALCVVGYEHQRLLLAMSPTGITLVSHLPAADGAEPEATPAAVSFSQALQQVLGRSR